MNNNGRSKGEVETAIRNAIIKFEQNLWGVDPTRLAVIDDAREPVEGRS